MNQSKIFANSRQVILHWVMLITLGLAIALNTGAAFAKNLPDFTELVKKHGAEVVNISTTQTIKRSRMMPDFQGRLPEGVPEDFKDFFRHFFPPGPDNEFEGEDDTEEFSKQSLGSGFIISKDGYILTNHHVIRDATEIVVRLSDRREYVAEVIGSDERSDLALLKVDANNLPVADIGSSDSLEVGEWVVAIGSPFGFDHTVTAGIVSAKKRALPRENYVPFIQTDVAINPGNSGGPLYNMDGKVVGINSQIYSRTGGFMGLSFSIPIDMAMRIADQLKHEGHVSRAWLGVMIQDVTRELAESFGMQKPRGALVARVLPDSPAEKAKLKAGDIITRFNGQEIMRSSNLPPMVGIRPVGDKAELEVLRDGDYKRITVTLGELPEQEQVAEVKQEKPQASSDNRIKLDIIDLTPDQRESLEIAKGGVVVTKVPAGPGRKAGIRRGDVIVKLNGVDVKNADHFNDIVDGLPEDKPVPVLLLRRGSPIFLALSISDDDS